MADQGRRPKAPSNAGSASVTTVDASAQPAAALRGLLILTHGPEPGRVFPLVGEAVRIGRAAPCEICVDDPSLSRLHATLQIARGEHFIKDEGSRNGTLRNGAPVEFASPLEDGDRLTLGSVRFRFTRTDERETQTLLELFGKRGSPVSANPAVRRVVRTPGVRSVWEQAERAARSPLSVLILGETGVGKEVLAEAIHEASPRAAKELLSINCAALTETLLEAELFGHERGAFTGAVGSKAGLIESANGGTVFFDEVGELPMTTQAKLLRVLEERRVLRVGGRSATSIDVRFVAATNRDLEVAVENGTFRRDLYYRLNAITLTIPPLRERRGDILELAEALCDEASALAGSGPPTLSAQVRELLVGYDWPGNVRELRNAIERAVVLSPTAEIGPDALPPSITGQRARSATAGVAPSAGPLEGSGMLADAVDRLERERILGVLQENLGNQTRTATALGISRRKLVARLSAWGLTKPRPR